MPVMGKRFAQLQALQYEMQQNPILVYQREFGSCTAMRPDGKAIDLLAEFGWLRLGSYREGPIDEAWLHGSCAGYAVSGGRSIVNLPSMTTRYATDYIFNQDGKMRSMSGGQLAFPITIWIEGAGRSPGMAGQHADAGCEVNYVIMPGIKVVCPSTVYDAKGLMHACLRQDDPIVYFDYTVEASADVPDEPFEVPIGKCAVRKEGKDITIATWAPANGEVAKAVETLAKEGISAEYIDIRTLKPYDKDTVNNSVAKTKALLVVTDGHYPSNFAHQVVSEAVMAGISFKGHVLAFPDAAPPGATEMIVWMTPTSDKIVDATKKILKA